MTREILTVAEMATADRAAVLAGTPTPGEAVAQAVRARYQRRPVVVWCGPGDNGGDGYVAARHLRRHGWPVVVEAAYPPATDACRWAASRWRGEVRTLSQHLSADTLYIDAIFGAGLSRSLEGEVAELARAAARQALTIVAVDAPSGVHGDTGRSLEGVALAAELTMTFHRRKPAHVLIEGRKACGDIVVADIGLASFGAVALFENEPGLWLHRYPWPAIDAHKHSRGRLSVVSGDAWNTGAARLAARGGLRIGAGAVTLLSPLSALSVNAGHLEAVMLAPFESDADLATRAAKADAVIIGPAAGVGEATARNLRALAQTGAALVADADALTSFREDPSELFACLDRDDVLTPHPGEFERIFPGLLGRSPERITAAREAASTAGAVILLKGADTVIAAPDGRAAVSVNGTPWLATAGSGDVLAGFIGGLLAQGMDSFEAACAGAWIHAECGALFGPGLIAEDLPGLAPKILARLHQDA
ncbi:MAG: bifunctional ADP-dependent NAD(P)H-hydrate dehydratase/NAD(P)H-hydrate epimerase [Caulobacter vibrioides]|uniref:Bifunctional NAD(P)H-hydrate repair enzyme n=1 Tax=Caulobacter vibrioides TaxID=155892 RepID=A0A258CVU5_CAUVI|nr:MAG: bifunctional ADP-dependent NAD(P)H-hydrate dehydratase/NAD(P)H-hydrate epimerase [Caulobacter vibrioides]